MRRVIIYFLVAAVVIFVLTRVGKRDKGQKIIKAPRARIEAVLGKALEMKSASPDQAKMELEKIVAEYPQTEQAQRALLEIADIDKTQGKLLEAKQALKKLIETYPDSSLLPSAEQALWNTNISILFSPLSTEQSMSYDVQPGDTLYRISRKFDTTVELMMASNNLQNALIKPGMKLKIAKAIFKIEVSKSKNTLKLYTDNEAIKIYSVATGEKGATPAGKFKITTRMVNPVWYKTGAIVPAGSPENILGTRWLGLSVPGYGIHGTVDPESIGKACTQGCVRMRNEEVEELFIIVPVGTEVNIIE